MNNQQLHGRIVDADSHEMIPSPLWPEFFGEVGSTFRDVTAQRGHGLDFGLNTVTLDTEADVLPIDDATVWRHEGWTSGPDAPGAIDMGRRVELLDFMGVERQQVFPTFGLGGLLFETMGPEFMRQLYRLDPEVYDLETLRRLGRDVIQAHNSWAIAEAKRAPSRTRMVGVLPVDDLTEMMRLGGELIDGGIKSFFVPASVPPAGMSPADRRLDPFWAMCAEAGAAVQIHLAFENFIKSNRWREIPEFDPERGISAEFVIDPWTFSTIHMVAENYLTTMTLGGVFERHPQLRFGTIESGAFWIAPMAENMDRWASQFSRRMAKVLSLPPSAYIARNVRATPFLFEPVERYIERYGFEDVYCYGSDYPHFEGGKDQIAVFLDRLTPLGDDVVEKFFVANGDWIVPA